MELEPSDGRTDVRRQHPDEFYADRGITLDNFEQVGARTPMWCRARDDECRRGVHRHNRRSQYPNCSKKISGGSPHWPIEQSFSRFTNCCHHRKSMLNSSVNGLTKQIELQLFRLIARVLREVPPLAHNCRSFMNLSSRALSVSKGFLNWPTSCLYYTRKVATKTFQRRGSKPTRTDLEVSRVCLKSKAAMPHEGK